MDDEVDWRLKLTTTIAEITMQPRNVQEIKEGDRLTLVSFINLPKKKTLTIPVPNLTALYISNSAKAWATYKELRTKQKIDLSLKHDVNFKSNKDAFDVLENIATAVISAYTAIESFCNDSIPEDHEYWHNNNSDVILEKADKNKLERYFSTTAKLNDVLPLIYNVEQPKGKSPVWVSYKKLKSCRDSLIHAKSYETRSVGTDKTNLWDKLFKLQKPHLLAKDVFSWYLSSQTEVPVWYREYPK